MLNVTTAFKTAIAQPSRQLKSRITIGSNVIADDYIQGIAHNSSIIVSDDFEIGTAVMSTIDIELFDKDGTLNYQFEDQEINTEIAVKLADTSFEYASLGLFTIEKAVRSNKKIKLTGCDRMYKFEKDYTSSLVYPATLLQIAQDICSKAGVTLKNTSFVNSTYSVPSMPTLEGITLRKAIAQIAELAGGYARITRDGKLEIINIGATKVADISKSNYIDFNNKDLTLASIDKVIVKLGAELATSGTGTNPIYIVDNIFCQDPNGVVSALYTSLNGLSYMPYNMRWQGNHALECGDKIAVITDKGTYNTIIASRKLTYKGGLREEYKSPGKSNTEKNSTGKGNIKVKMAQFESEVKVLRDEINQQVTRTEFDDLGQRVSTAETTITQNADQIALKVSKDEIGSEITQNAESVKVAFNGVSGNITEVDNQGLKVSHTDGSYSRLGAAGIKKYIGGTGKDYHYLTYVGTATVSTGSPVTITLPEEFKGKDFKITVSIASVNASSAFIINMACGYDSVNNAAGTFRITASANSGTYSWLASSVWDPDLYNYVLTQFSSLNFYTGGGFSVQVSYTVIA